MGGKKHYLSKAEAVKKRGKRCGGRTIPAAALRGKGIRVPVRTEPESLRGDL